MLKLKLSDYALQMDETKDVLNKDAYLISYVRYAEETDITYDHYPVNVLNRILQQRTF